MGSIYGIINLLVGAWFYRTARAVKKPAITWAAIGASVFLGCLIAGYGLNYLLQIISGGDTTTMGPAQSATGADFTDYETNYAAILYEFIPLILGLVGSAIVRSVFLLKSGIKDTFNFSKLTKVSADDVVQSADPEKDQSADSAPDEDKTG
ncbi:MAG: hypothetical protein K0U68_02355 [Gammaproteobacteria bacterium]|nr:hypothetical protein [Gammaproteobacteria bacterium]